MNDRIRARGAEAWTDGVGRLAGVAEAASALVENVVDHVRALADDVDEDAGDVARELAELRDATRERLEDARGAVRAAPRIARLVGELLAVVARYRLQNGLRAARQEIWGGDEAEAQEARVRLDRRSARRVRRLCEELRGGVLKLGQFASTRMDLLPPAWVEELSRLQDRVRPLPAEVVSERLDHAFGPDWGEHFADFEPEPLAAASLAQVHGATRADGRRVAVKLLVPGIEDVVATDLAALRLLLPSVRELLPRTDLDTVFAELAQALRHEVDLVAEAQGARAMARAFADDPDVVVPEVHEDACAPGVLVLERVDGQRLLDFLAACVERGEPGARDRDRILSILVRVHCDQMLSHGLYQADPHPGNFLVVPGPAGPRLALLDFGNLGRLDAPVRRAYAQLALSVLGGRREEAVTHFDALGFRSRDGTPDAFHAFADLMLDAFREGARLDDPTLDPREQALRVLELMERNPVVELPGHFVQLGRVFASIGGLLLYHRPRIDLGGILVPRLAATLAGPPA